MATDTPEYDRSSRLTTLKAFSWYEVEKPELPYLQAMLAASPVKKGIFYDGDTEMWLPIMLKPDFQARPDPVFVDAGASRFAVPFYDPDGTILPRVEIDTTSKTTTSAAQPPFTFPGRYASAPPAAPAAKNDVSSARLSMAPSGTPHRFRRASRQGRSVTGSARRVMRWVEHWPSGWRAVVFLG